MAQRKPNKRIQKKQTQTQQRKKLVESGQSKKAVQNMGRTALNKEYQKVQRKETYQNRREYLESKGIPKSIISQKQLYRRSDSFLQDKENLKQWRKEGRELDRFRKLKKAGYKESEIKKSWLRYDKITNQKIREFTEYKVYESPYFLCLQYADIMKDSDIDPDMYKNYSLEELIEMIHERLEDAQLHPDDSSTFHGAFRMATGKSESDMRHIAKQYEQHGYNVRVGKFSKKSYSTLTVRRDWSPREMAESLLIIMEHSKNIDAIHAYESFKDYAMTFDSDAIKDIFR